VAGVPLCGCAGRGAKAFVLGLGGIVPIKEHHRSGGSRAKILPARSAECGEPARLKKKVLLRGAAVPLA